MEKNQRGINLDSKPSGAGCVECLASADGWWFHLRRCAECWPHWLLRQFSKPACFKARGGHRTPDYRQLRAG